MSNLQSALYVGEVFHSRKKPKPHSFKYRLFMLYLDLEELDDVLQLSKFWGRSRLAIARFKREDFHGDPTQPLAQSVLDTVERVLCFRPTGPVRMLANFRYFGVIMNPLVVYYCFDSSGTKLEALVAEVNNTPWNEKHPYVLDCRTAAFDGEFQKHKFSKEFTVSPFNPLNMVYHWESSLPRERVRIKIENEQHGEIVFNACLNLERVELSGSVLTKILIQFPLLSVKVISAIYWQAMNIFIKGNPFLGKNTVLNKSGEVSKR